MSAVYFDQLIVNAAVSQPWRHVSGVVLVNCWGSQ